MTKVYIDGDVLVYKAAHAAEREFRWPDGVWTYHASEEDGIKAFKWWVDKILKECKSDTYTIAVSDYEENFRKTVYPPYKSNREDTRKPLLLNFLREHVEKTYSTVDLASAEADDVLGILATIDSKNDVDCIIATVDKDLLQIPVDVYNIDKGEVSLASTRDCERMFHTQILTGDPVDGYPGCPGVGAETAAKILDDPHILEEYEHVFKSGPRKGLRETRFRKGPSCSVWEAIVSRYNKEGLTEDDALAQARCAKILQDDNLSKEGEIVLWTPKN